MVSGYRKCHFPQFSSRHGVQVQKCFQRAHSGRSKMLISCTIKQSWLLRPSHCPSFNHHFDHLRYYRFKMQILACLLIPQLVSAVAIGARDDRSRAAYFLDNNPAGSSIISLKISPDDGTLSNPIRTPTGGKGLFGLTASSTGGTPAAGGADTLFTQDSVIVSQNVSVYFLLGQFQCLTWI